jgi:hypothetical protein
MIPIVEPDPTQDDRRKGKSLKRQEAKVCLAHPLGSTPLTYGGALEGGVEGAGRHLLHCAVKAGLGPDTTWGRSRQGYGACKGNFTRT